LGGCFSSAINLHNSFQQKATQAWYWRLWEMIAMSKARTQFFLSNMNSGLKWLVFAAILAGM
jgi:hypothetical protein